MGPTTGLVGPRWPWALAILALVGLVGLVALTLCRDATGKGPAWPGLECCGRQEWADRVGVFFFFLKRGCETTEAVKQPHNVKALHTDLSLELRLHHGIRLTVVSRLGHRHAVLRVGHAHVWGRGVHVGPAVNTLSLQGLHTDQSGRLKPRRCPLEAKRDMG